MTGLLNEQHAEFETHEKKHSQELFDEFQTSIHSRTDRLFVYLMSVQWLGGIIAALVISPKTWEGTISQTHIHVWAAVLIGGLITSLPVFLCLKQPGQVLNRHVVAAAQMLTSALLIHLTGGRIETHFHVFGSLAFLAFYRDRSVIITATIVVALDHFVRGVWWPQSVFGVLTSSHWRWIEHAAWVIFEDIFLFISINQSLNEMKSVSVRQAKMEYLNIAIEKRVIERTKELHQEIVEKKRAEDELRDREALLRSTLESTAEGILVVDAKGNVTHFNSKFQEMWRIPIKIMESKNAYKMREFAMNQVKNPEEFAKRSIEELIKSCEELSEIIELKDGRVFFRYSRPLANSQVEGGRLLSYRDITEQRKSEQAQQELRDQLERAERLESLGKLAGGVAHDLNNMLGPVVGYSEMLLNELPEKSKAASRASKIKKSAEQAAVVIQDLLTLARRGKYEMRLVNVNDIVKEYIESPAFESLAAKYPGIKTKLDLSKNAGNILGSVPHLSKVIMNLVTNAYEAMLQNGKLKITTEKLSTGNGDYVLLKIKDSGHGIAEEDMDKIFEPFFSKKQMGSSGTGLGLSVVYGIVKDHKGLCDVQSQVAKGTEFILYFPSALGVNAPKQGVQYSVVGGTETILVVDDSHDQRELIHEIVDNLGYFVITAPDGVFAVDFIKSQDVDLVILDMIMEPGFDGLDTYREMLKVNPTQRAIVVSGYSESERVQEVLNLGAAVFVKKPYSMDTLANAIRKALDKPLALLTESDKGPGNKAKDKKVRESLKDDESLTSIPGIFDAPFR